jgi:hypothetical protein
MNTRKGDSMTDAINIIEAPPIGVYLDIPYEVYRSWDAINYSSISKGKKSIRAMHQAMTHNSNPTAAQGLGTATHLAILEPDLFAGAAVFDGNRKTKGYKTFEEGQEGACMTLWERDAAQCLADTVRRDMEAVRLVDQSKHEACLVWYDKAYGTAKIRLDMLGSDYFADVKTARDISPAAISNAFFGRFGFNYYLQWGWAAEALNHLIGKGHGFEGWLIAVETGDVADGYAAQVEGDVMEQGRRDCVEIAKEYAACKAAGNFWGVARGDIPLVRLPEYMKEEWEVGQ